MKFEDKMIEKLMMIFVFGGVFGFVYEEIFYRIDLGFFVKRGTTFGPWIPIYGFGAVLMILLARRFVKTPWKVFLLCVVIAGVLELTTGVILDKGFGVRLWDYNKEIWNWGNVGGYICLRSILFFGVSALFLHYLVYLFFCRVADKLEGRCLMVLSVIPAGLFVLDIVVNAIGTITGF